MTLAVAGAIEGRPSYARIREDLARARAVNVDLRSRLAVERIESAEFAEHVRRIAGTNLRRGIELGREDLVDQARNDLVPHSGPAHRPAGGALMCRGCSRTSFPGLIWCAACVVARFFGGRP